MVGEVYRIRNHGFERPYETTQVLSWIVFTYIAFLYFLLGLPSYWSSASRVIGLAIPFVLLCIVTAISAYIATATNPVDAYVAGRDWSRANMTDERVRLVRETMPLHTEWCYNCKWYVGKNSYHCRRCDKCSDGLDHHCSFLNNCIGNRNYNAFVVCTFSACLLAVTQIIFYVYLLVESYSSPQWIIDNLLMVYSSYSSTMYRSIIAGTLVLLFVTCLLLGQLLAFHLFLWYRGQLTHEYLMGDNSVQASHEASSSSGTKKHAKNYAYCGFWPSRDSSASSATNIELDSQETRSSEDSTLINVSNPASMATPGEMTQVGLLSNEF